jgi:hypothetical protein
MCLKITHKFCCGHETWATAPCATSRSQSCGVNNVKRLKHDEACAKCDHGPSSIWNLKETPEFDPVESSRWLNSEPESQWETQGDGAGKGKEKENNTHVPMKDSWQQKRPGSAKTADENLQDDSGLIFITGASPTDFKTKISMNLVRKKAMDSFLKGDGGRINQKSRFSRQPPALVPERPAGLDFEDSRNPELSIAGTSYSTVVTQTTQDEPEPRVKAYSIEPSVPNKIQEKDFPTVRLLQPQPRTLKLLDGSGSKRNSTNCALEYCEFHAYFFVELRPELKSKL